MPVDIEKYRRYVEHCDLTEAQKTALLEDLWSILESFADEAWGLCPTQHIATDNDELSGIKPLKNIDYPEES